MNILEIYVDYVHKVEEITIGGVPWVRVDISTNCYGSKQRTQESFPRGQWEQIKNDGYYMG